MPRSHRIRVRTAELVAAVEKKIETCKAQHERALAAWPAHDEAYRAALCRELRTRADKIEAGGPLPEVNWGSVVVSVKATRPTKPTYDASRMERTLRTLKMAADEAITISADDYAEYLR